MNRISIIAIAVISIMFASCSKTITLNPTLAERVGYTEAKSSPILEKEIARWEKCNHELDSLNTKLDSYKKQVDYYQELPKSELRARQDEIKALEDEYEDYIADASATIDCLVITEARIEELIDLQNL